MRYLYIGLIMLILLVGCATTEEQPQETSQMPLEEPIAEEPAETLPDEEKSPIDELKEVIKIPNDIKEILEKGKTKLKSYSYNYKNPDINLPYNIYVKGNKIKIVLPEIINVEGGKFYNIIYIDTEKKTAEAYCAEYSSCGADSGKIKDLNYEDTYIETPLDWIAKVTEAVVIDERMVERRNAVYLETNIGKIIVESYYGFLYRIEDGSNKWEFTDASLNSVKDSDVNIPENLLPD